MRDERTSSDMPNGIPAPGGYDTDSTYDPAYGQPFQQPAAYDQSPLDAEGGAGFNKVRARRSYSLTPGQAPARGRDASPGGEDSPVKKVVGAVGGALAAAKDAVVGAVSGISDRVSSNRAASVEPIAEGDYAGVGDPCRVCGNPVGEHQERCPHCGAFRKPIYTYPAFIAATLATVLLIVLLTLLLNSCSTADAPNPAQNQGATPTAEQGGDQGGDQGGQGAMPNNEEKVTLAGAIASAQSTYDAQVNSRTYTIYSVAQLGNAINAANAVYVDQGATTEQINAAVQALSDAAGALKIMPGGEGYETPSYADLTANMDYYTGGLVVESGTVSSVTSENGSSVAMVALNGESASLVQVTYRDSELFSDAPVVGNELLFYGTVSGTAPFTDATGASIQVPAVVGDYVVIV